MTALEIRLLGYALLGLLVIGGSGWIGHKLTRMHYEALIARDRDAQDQALQTAQRNVIAAQQAQAAAEQRAEQDHETLVQADTASRAAILGSVRSLETALHLSSLSTPVDHSGQSGGAAPGSASSDGLGDLVEQLNERIAQATAACQHDSAELAGILELAPRS